MSADNTYAIKSRSIRRAARGEAAVANPELRLRDSVPTRERILQAAYQEFAQYGFAGARVDRINAHAKVNPRMIYHLFGSKERLYQAVLLEAYSDIRRKEAKLDIEHLGPVAGIMALFEFTFEHFAKNPHFIWLLTNENLMRGKLVLSTSDVTKITSPLRASLERLVRRGIASKVLSANVDPIHIYVTIAALSWFHLSNAYTLSAMFGEDLTTAKWRATRKTAARSVLQAYLSGADGALTKRKGRRRQSKGNPEVAVAALAGRRQRKRPTAAN